MRGTTKYNGYSTEKGHLWYVVKNPTTVVDDRSESVCFISKSLHSVVILQPNGRNMPKKAARLLLRVRV